MLKRSLLLIALFIFTPLVMAKAVNLMDVYHAALKNDPTFKAAEATFLDNKEVGPQARAALLPTFGATGSAVYGWEDNDSTGIAFGSGLDGRQRTLTYSLKLTQVLFNWSAFAGWSAAKSTVKQAEMTFEAAKQDLMTRTATAYFAVLEAKDILRFTLAQRRALASQLEVAREQYKVGTQPVTVVYQAKAAYDAVNADYIANMNEVSNKLEELRVITGTLYSGLAKLKAKVPLLSPEPKNIQAWTQKATAGNLSLKAAQFAAMAAKSAINARATARLPTIDLVGEYGGSNKRYLSGATASTSEGPKPAAGSETRRMAATIGVEASMDLFQGGGLSSLTRQAEAQYQLALALLDKSNREVIANTRKAYLGVLAGISQVRADAEAVKSSRSALESTRAGYKVGTETMNDVLIAQQLLFEAETDYAKDRINYLLTTLALKEAAGSLSEIDLAQLNKWLRK